MAASDALLHVIDAVEQTARLAASIDSELGAQFAAIAQRDEDLRVAVERLSNDVKLMLHEIRNVAKRLSVIEGRVDDHDLLLDLRRSNGA